MKKRIEHRTHTASLYCKGWIRSEIDKKAFLKKRLPYNNWYPWKLEPFFRKLHRIEHSGVWFCLMCSRLPFSVKSTGVAEGIYDTKWKVVLCGVL